MTQSPFPEVRAVNILLSIACLLTATTVPCQVASRSGDMSCSVGYDHVGQGTNGFALTSGNSITLGFNGGYNLDRYVEAGGEFNFFNDPQNDPGASLRVDVLNYGGMVRFNLAPKSRVVPYGVFGIGGSHSGVNLSSASVNASGSENGYYVGLGGGASIYLGPKWGVRAELRDDYNHFTHVGIINSTSIFAMTGGVFFQFGGHSGNRK